MAASFPNLYDYSTDTGMVVPITGDIKAYVQNAMYDIFGADMNLADETPAGRLVEALTLMFKNVVGVNAQNLSQLNLQYATGNYLDALANFFGIERLQPTHSQVAVEFFRTDTSSEQYIIVPAGTKLQDGNGNIYSVVEEVKISKLLIPMPEGTGFARAFIVADEAGPIWPAMPNSRYVTPNRYVSFVDYSGPVTPYLNRLGGDYSHGNVIGRGVETDFELRQRLAISRDAGSSSTTAIANTIWKAVPDCRCVRILENNTSSNKTINGATLKPYSIFVCLSCDGLGYDEMNQPNEKLMGIAKAIYMSKAAGVTYTDTNGGTASDRGAIIEDMIGKCALNTGTPDLFIGKWIVEVTDPSTGVKTNVIFYTPEQKIAFFTIKLMMNGYSGTDIKADIMRICNQYIGGKITDLTTSELTQILTSSISGIFITQMTFSELVGSGDDVHWQDGDTIHLDAKTLIKPGSYEIEIVPA